MKKGNMQYFEVFNIGDKTVTRGRTVTEIINFAAFSGDWYPLHEDMAILAFYGLDRVKFTAPTRIGDIPNAELEVAGKQEGEELGGLVIRKWSIENQRGEKAARDNFFQEHRRETKWQ